MTYAYLFLMTVPLMRLDGAAWPCPFPCRCTLEIINCSRIASSHGLHQVPLLKPAVHHHPFEYLDFTGNAISSIGKEAWQSYPWAEYLVLKGNSLSRLQNSSLEGLLSLTYLDLSCNKIQIIEGNAFEAVPFLQIINLSGNIIERIIYGAFRAWHGMQFLLKVDLSHNPLALIQDSYFYRLPTLKLLDLGATEITPVILEDLLQTSLQLRTLILPPKMFCCLCQIKDDIEVLSETVKLQCTGSCAVTATLCENEESLNRLQEELMKALETRKLNDSSLLSIVPERATSSNEMLAPNYTSLAANFNLLKSVTQLIELKANESLDLNLDDKGELKTLHLLASLLQAALKAKIAELDKDSTESAVQNESSAQVSETSTDEASEDFADTARRKVRQVRNVRRERWLGTNKRNKATLFRLRRDRRESPKPAMPSVDQTGISELHSKAESWRKLAEDVSPQRDISHLRSQQGVLRASWKRSVSDSPPHLKLIASIKMGNNENDLTRLPSDRNSVPILGDGLGAHSLTEEELLQWLLHRHEHPEGEGTSEISAVDSEPSLSEISPDIMSPHRTNWEHQRFSVSPPLNFLAPHDDYLIQGDLFEAEVNKQLASLIPNAPVRKLISCVIRILKMDCTEPMMERPCAKLIARTGLLMRHFSMRENLNETSFLWMSYFRPSNNISNMATASSRKLGKPSEIISSPETPRYGYRNNLLLAILVTGIIMIIITVICLIEMCSRRSAGRDGFQERLFLGRRKKSFPDRERTGSLVKKARYSHKASYQPLDEMEKYDNELSSEEEEIFSQGNARPSLQEAPVKKTSSRTSSMSQPPPALSTPSRKSSMKSSGGTYATASLKAADEGNKDEESSVVKSESHAAETVSEAVESGEGEGEEEEEDEESE